ncbi:MAG: LOG family protein [Candidatus Margulisiibacteriota bacterium]|nr:LOG family protein [Candidatus Margulisiibacteriota bacterium]
MAKRGYVTGNPEIDSEIDRLAKKYSTPRTREYIQQLFMTVVKLHLDKADERDLYLVNVTLKELRHIFRTFNKYRDVRKVVIFGSHRSLPKSKEYKITENFARKIVERDWMVITGGGGGVMEAGNLGAGKKGFAVKIKLPQEFKPNPYVSRGEKLINVKYFFTRKLAFLKESDATVLFPGGFGTHDEGFEVLTLLQTGKATPRPIVFVESPGKTYWKTWFRFLKKELLRGKYLIGPDFKLFSVVNSAEAAVKEVTDFYRVYHSIRYGKEITIVRLNEKVSDRKLERLSGKYQDMIDGGIRPSGPLPSEVRGKELLDKPRICMKFDRKSFGRLMEFIRDLNG